DAGQRIAMGHGGRRCGGAAARWGWAIRRAKCLLAVREVLPRPQKSILDSERIPDLLPEDGSELDGTTQNGGISLRFAWRAGRAALGVMSLVLSDFEQSRGAHAATDTHGDHHVFHATALAFDQGVAHQTRTGHAVGVADGDAAAVDVVLVRVDAQEV